VCSITGVIMIALPMVVIGQNFADHYSQMRLETQETEDRCVLHYPRPEATVQAV
jgi:hypothetical protein